MTFDELVERLDDLTSVSLHDVSKESLVADLGWDSLDLTVAYFLILDVRPDSPPEVVSELRTLGDLYHFVTLEP